MKIHGALARVTALTLTHLVIGMTVCVAATVRISNLQDVSLLLLNPFVNASNSQSDCVFSSTATKGYNVKAMGSGTASAFTLSAGGSVPVLPYTVEWSQTAGQSTGAILSPGVPLTGLVSTATQQSCSSGPPSTASLIVLLSATNLQAASAGITYTGVLTLIIAPE